ncbi:Lrp/AsnC family transcriptional regulator [Pedobacter nototheniae]|uniref:Lrp/AsnC family transcriptional regulator n=1 Tax=Pedobacter nototheniae TaxID=2488994 RepID=UPI002931CEE9|nr:Lrp/AsnC family transcriptional regulator [Pedobacter nototheniae]
MSANTLDQTDIAILNLLQKDGLMTQKEMSHQLQKSITSVVERVKKLKEAGFIKNTVALVNIQKIKSLFIAFPHIQLTNHSEEVLRQFELEVVKLPEVMECYRLTGNFDFMLKMVMPDMVTYNEFLQGKLRSLPHVGSIQSFLALSEVKHQTAYPL